MDKTIEQLLDEQIEAEFGEIAHLEISSDAKSKGTDNLIKLLKAREERLKNESERQHNLDLIKLEEEKLEHEKEGKKTQWFYKALEIGVPAVVSLSCSIIGCCAYSKWLKVGLKYEETGTITNPHTKSLISSMLPKFKK